MAGGGAVNGLPAVRPKGKGDLTGTGVVGRYRKGLRSSTGTCSAWSRKAGSSLRSTRGPGNVIGRARLLGALDNYFASPVVADGKLCLVKSERQGRAQRFGSLLPTGPAGSHSTRSRASAAAT